MDGSIDGGVDPEIQQRFDANLADYQDRVGRLAAGGAAERDQIAQRSAAIDKEFDDARGQRLREVYEKLKKSQDPEQQPQRLVGWNPTEGSGAPDESVMSFNDDDVATHPEPVRRRAPRHRAADEDDDYYAEQQSWLRD
jgi:hypothetical protein